MKAGTIVGKCMPRHRATEFRKFLDEVERNVPVDLDSHVVMDNYGTHKPELPDGIEEPPDDLPGAQARPRAPGAPGIRPRILRNAPVCPFIWIMVQDGKASLDTIRRTRPETQQAWERSTRPADGFTYNAKAHRVRITFENR